MPTKKRRVGFIPRKDALDLINKISFENNLSNAKVINILVEEALYKRGLFNLYKVKSPPKNTKNIHNNENLNLKEAKEELFDNEIYLKFLMFLQFQERMKKSDN